MASRVFDFRELDEFSNALISNAMRDQPKRIKKFLNKQGYALRKKPVKPQKQKCGRKRADIIRASIREKFITTEEIKTTKRFASTTRLRELEQLR